MPRGAKTSKREIKGSPRAPKGSQELPKSDQKSIKNRTRNGPRFHLEPGTLFLTTKKRFGACLCSSNDFKKTCLSNGTGSALLGLETFEHASQHVPKKSTTPHSCAWPTYLCIYLSIHQSSPLAKQAMTAYSHPKVYENTPQGHPK